MQHLNGNPDHYRERPVSAPADPNPMRFWNGLAAVARHYYGSGK